MRKFAKPISAIALLLAMLICFSGCGVIDFARSVIQKNDETGVPTNADTNQYVIDNNQVNQSVTNNVAIVPPSTTGTTVATTPSTTESSKTNSTTSTTKKPTNTTTQATVPTTTPPVTNAPVVEEGVTNEELKDLTVKEIQDLLFATADPNTAGKILQFAGFEYDQKQGIYYSQMNPLQRNFGFNFVYDMAAPMVGMVYDTKRIEFVYNNKQWMVQIWKGQYGITSGAEVGLYNRPLDRVMQYDCADDEELIEMQFDFYNQDQLVFSRGPEKHWWLTGFKVFHIGIPMLIDLDITLDFTDKEMAQAFAQSLRKVASSSTLDPITYRVIGTTVKIKW